VTPSFAIDALPEQAGRYREDHVLVAVDVFRATTVILTALARGRAVFPVATPEAARRAAERIPAALLAGEQRGEVPSGFDLDNSPALLDRLPGERPLVLVTSAGTRLLECCRGAPRVHVACLRNLRSTAEHLAESGGQVALLGAGTAGEPRPEDQLACAWIGERLLECGFAAENEATVRAVREFRGAGLRAVIEGSRSTAWLRANGKGEDVDFVLAHVDDLDAVAALDGEQVTLAGRPVASGTR
jgi:2-phosphosulfolactate phosphatase